jgi:hypothetical protein
VTTCELHQFSRYDVLFVNTLIKPEYLVNTLINSDMFCPRFRLVHSPVFLFVEGVVARFVITWGCAHVPCSILQLPVRQGSVVAYMSCELMRTRVPASFTTSCPALFVP